MNMSKRKEEGEYGSAENGGQPDGTPWEEGAAAAAESTAGNDSSPDGKNGAFVPPTFLAIEEHAKAKRISAPVFAAVRQMKGWSEGKKVEETEFTGAVNAFLNAPAGASAPVGGKK
jgi:hypothetical protein